MTSISGSSDVHLGIEMSFPKPHDVPWCQMATPSSRGLTTKNYAAVTCEKCLARITEPKETK